MSAREPLTAEREAERRERYVEAVLRVTSAAGLYRDIHPYIYPVLNVADEEMAALRAEVERLERERDEARARVAELEQQTAATGPTCPNMLAVNGRATSCSGASGHDGECTPEAGEPR
ncbi:hypothetical protein ACFSJS_22760 [Streptomyces desertarenae]|uniref:Uncharacterized protein n=1 Tax=Streptomyces desertarenae TaxID=2666184 RepID=A0ABW4PQT5_9ACTN